MKTAKPPGHFLSKNSSSNKKHGTDRFKRKSKKSRKEKRKEARLLKKARNLAFHQRKPMPVSLDNSVKKEEEKEKKKEERKQRLKEMKKKQKLKKEEKIMKEKELKKQHMIEEIEKEEKIIKQLEKHMKLNKRKSKSLPKSFFDDGLDYLMDVIDKEKVKDLYEDTDVESDAGSDASSDASFASDDQEVQDMDEETTEDFRTETTSDNESDEFENDSDSALSEDSDFSKISGNKQSEISPRSELTGSSKSILKRTASPNKEVKKGVKKKKTDKKVLWKDEALESLEEVQESNGSNDSETQSEVEEHVKTSFTEDIYGRLRDNEGNIVTSDSQTGGYVPPAKRLQLASADGKKKQQLERLKKQLKGLINRTSEANMSSISSQIEDMFMSNSRAEMSDLLTSIILESTVSNVLTPERLTMELIMLLSILHTNVGPEIGAYFLQELAKNFFKIAEETEDMESHSKEMDNLVMIFCHMYNFKVIHSILIKDVLKRFVDSFREKEIEFILMIVKNVGVSLRKDDPTALKEIIINIQEKASSVDTSTYTDQSRVRFMLDILLAIKNNNMRKIPNYDPEHLDHLKKVTRSFTRGNSLGSNQLNISLTDLLDAEHKGRWWMVGAAWDGQGQGKDSSFPAVISGTANTRIMDLAKKQRMNTDIRKNIFYVLMTSEDCVDAFEKLIRLGLKHQQEREIIHVIVDCCLQEKKFNLFYGYLLQKFCEYDRRFQMTFQFHMWDKFKVMSNLSETNRENLGKLVTHLIITSAISLSIFKTVEFGTLEKQMVRFLKQVLSSILLNYPEDATKVVFTRIASLSKLKHLHEGLTLFMRHFLARQKKSSPVENPLLLERVNLANNVLNVGQSKVLF